MAAATVGPARKRNMPDEYYPEMGGEDEGGQTTADEPVTGEKDSGEAEGATALVPKAVLGGKTFEPGEEVVFKITKVYDDEVEIEYAKEPKDKEETPDKNPLSPDELDMMGTKGEY